MFERLNAPEEAYNFKLGATLKMEQTVLEILGDNIDQAQDDKLKQLFRHHEEETREQIAKVERVFTLFGWEVDDSPCPAIEGLQKEGKANVKKSDDAIVDSVIVQGAVEVEHHEIGVYENLIINAKAMERPGVVELLQKNLEQEKHTLSELKPLQTGLAAVTPKETVDA